MGRRTDTGAPRRRARPATSPDDREQQIANSAYDLAEQQILEGTASAMVIGHFLKAGSGRELLERQRLEHEAQLTQAKIEAMESASRMEELYSNAILAMGSYQGRDPEEDRYDEYGRPREELS